MKSSKTSRMIGTCTRAVVEAMTTNATSDSRRESYAAVTAALLAFVLAVVLIGFTGQWLWNNVIVELFTFARPSHSVWMLVGLKLFIALILA